MIVTPDKRVVPVPAVGAIRTGSAYRTAAVSEPAGSSLFTTAVFLGLKRDLAGSDVLFSRGFTNGWVWSTGNSLLLCTARNSTPATVVAQVTTTPYVGSGLLAIGRYNDGNMSLWVNGVLIQSTTLGSGFLAQALNVSIGCRGDSASANSFDDGTPAECVFMNAYDAEASFPGGAVALSQQWMEDLQQGRYLTWPRSPVVNSDYYWSARDAVTGPGTTEASWVDRISGIVLVREGTPQAAQVMPRF